MTTILEEARWPLFHTVAFGDSENDLPLMRRSGQSVAVANATTAVKYAADAIVEACRNDGVAKFIQHLLRDHESSLKEA